MKRIFYLLFAALIFITACGKQQQQTPASAISQTKNITLSLDKIINDSTIVLKWSKYNNAKFKAYDLKRTSWGFTNGAYQSTSILLKSFTSVDSLTYTERNMPYSNKILYTVIGVADTSAYSNVITYNRPNTTFLQAEFNDAVIDKQNKILYLIYKDNGTISAFNYATNTFIKKGSLGVTVSPSSLGTFGGATELYVPANDGNIYIIDGATLATKDKIKVSTYRANSVVPVDGKLFVSWASDENSFNTSSVRVYDRSTKQIISSTGYYNNTRLLWLPNTAYEFIEVTGSIAPTQFQYYKFDSSALSLSKFTYSDIGGPNINNTILKAFPDGSRFIVSFDGNVFTKNLVREGFITNFSSDPNARYSDFEINNLGSIIYCAEAYDRAINVVSYPAVKLQKSFNTQLYPSKIFIDGNQLICVCIEGGNVSHQYYINIEKFNL